MKIAGALLQGKQHKLHGTRCQDVIGSYRNHEYSIMVLSDGAGSKEYGFECAQIMVDATLHFFKDYYENGCKDFDKKVFCHCINDSLSQEGLNSENAGATLIFMFEYNKRYIIGHLGDGCVLCKEEGVFNILSYPENGEMINQTFFFPSEYAEEHLRIVTGNLNAGMHFILTSDGLSDLLFDFSTGTVAEACYKLSNWFDEYSEEEMKSILEINLLNVFSEKTNDDMSIIICKCI